MKRNNLFKVALLVLATLFVSCSDEGKQLRSALNYSGKAKQELQKVLDYYKNDPEKLKAAKFLISNMPAHISYTGDDIESFYIESKRVISLNMIPEFHHDSILSMSNNRFLRLRKQTVPDIMLMKSDYLIYSIDHAFEQWKTRPWCQHLTFDEFCEWLLPYKVVEKQRLDAWRDTLSKYFTDTLSTISENDYKSNTIYNCVEAVRTEIVNKIHPRVIWGVRHGYSLYSSELMPKWTFGTCEEYVSLGVMTFRSVGLPAVIDRVPVWGRKNVGHTWYTVLSDNGRKVNSPDCIISPLGWDFYPYERFPKVFRRLYSINKETAKYNDETKYKYSFDVCSFDVTDEYNVTSDIVIPIDKNTIKDKYAYISMLVNQGGPEWSIIDYGHYKRGKAVFKKMGRNNMYIVMGYNGQTVTPISDPFILEKDGTIRYISADEDNLVSIDLRRKYFESYNVVTMRNRVLGGKIQCSNNKDFSEAVTVLDINNLDIINSPVEINNQESYRYWRYLSPNGSYGSIAELSFIGSDNKALQGNPIGCEAASDDVIRQAFDGNYLSNFELYYPNADGNWVGMDYGRPVSISKVLIVPRTDDNDIYPGHDYELKMWNGKYWVPIERKESISNTIHFDSVPKGALLWLSDHTRGFDERAFIVNDNGEIEWW